MAEQSLTGRNIAVRGNKPPDVGIVVSGVEVVPAGFDVEVIATVAERVDIGDVGFIVRNIVTAAVGDLPVVPPRVVHILRNKCSGSIADRCYISLKVLVVPVLRSVVLKTHHAAGGIVYVVLCTRRGCPPSGFLIFRAVTYIKKLNPGRQTSPPIYHSAYQKVS